MPIDKNQITRATVTFTDAHGGSDTASLTHPDEIWQLWKAYVGCEALRDLRIQSPEAGPHQKAVAVAFAPFMRACQT